MKTTIIYPDKKPESAPEDHADTVKRSVEQPYGKGEPEITVVNHNTIVGQDEDDIEKNPHRYSADDVLRHYQEKHGRKVN